MSFKRDIIGRVEKINFPTLNIKGVPAKIDTGADSSSLWCSKIKKIDGELSCVLFAPESTFYTGKTLVFKIEDVSITRVANSFGHRELRYKVKLPIQIKDRTIKVNFTLTDRSSKLYPVLIGRNTLQGKFVVDVSKGNPLRQQENKRKKRLQAEMERLKEELNEDSNII